MRHLAPGVDVDKFHPDVDGATVRERYGLGDRPVDRVRVPAGAAQGPGHADPGACRTCVRQVPGRDAADRQRRTVPGQAQGAGPRLRRRRARRLHRFGAATTSCPPTTRPATSTRCRAVPGADGAGRRRARHRLPGGVGERPAGRGRRLRRRTGRRAATARPGYVVGGRDIDDARRTAGRVARPTATSRPGWARPVGPGPRRSGAGTCRRPG